MRVLLNMNYKFYYYCFFYLLFFEEWKGFCVSRRTEKYHEYFKVDFDKCIDIEILELFFFNWWNHISSRFQFEEMRCYLVSNQSWDEQKSFFLWWKRSVNDVRVKIQCYETRMSWTVNDIKESSFLIIQSTVYYWNRRHILIAQFNYSVVNFSENLMTRWLTWIHLFDFNIWHVFNKKHTAADELSWRFREFLNDIDEVYKKNIDDFIDD